MAPSLLSRAGLTGALLLLAVSLVHAMPTVSQQDGRTLVTGDAYRATFRPESVGLDLEMTGPDGEWHAVANRSGAIAFAYFRNRIDSIVAESGKRIERILAPLGRQKK